MSLEKQCGISDAKTSYSELIDQSSRWSGFLKQCKLGKGDIVALVSENSPTYVPIFLGTIAIGAALSPINNNLTPGLLFYVLFYQIHFPI